MATEALKVPLGASVIRALGLAEGDLPKSILAALERELDKDIWITVYATFYPETPCTGAGKSGGEESGHGDDAGCCKFGGISVSPKEESSVHIKARVPDIGELVVEGKASLDPHIVDKDKVKPEGGCPEKCQDESVQFIVELVYHFEFSFELHLELHGQKAPSEISFGPRIGPLRATTRKDEVDVGIGGKWDCHDHLKVFATCGTIVDDSKERRPWIDSLAPSEGGHPSPPHKPHGAGHSEACRVKIRGKLLGFAPKAAGGMITIDGLTNVAGDIKAADPKVKIAAGGSVNASAMFELWDGEIANGCNTYLGLECVLDLKLLDSQNNELGKTKATIKHPLYCPDDNKVGFTDKVNFGSNGSVTLYVRADLAC